MRYKIVVSFKDADGNIKEEKTAVFSVRTQQEAKFKLQINREVAEKRHGRANVIDVRLIPVE